MIERILNWVRPSNKFMRSELKALRMNNAYYKMKNREFKNQNNQLAYENEALFAQQSEHDSRITLLESENRIMRSAVNRDHVKEKQDENP